MATPTDTPPTEDPGPAPDVAARASGLHAVACSVIAVAAALGLGELVAAIVSPQSSPFLAVGQGAIRLTPEPLKELAIAWFGTNDKLALLVGMSTVIVAITVLAGLASRRDPRPGLVVVVLMGLLGIVAVISLPTFSPLDLLAPALALVAGVTVWTMLHSRAVAAGSGATGSATGSDDDGGGRRRFLTVAGLMGFNAVAAGIVGRLLASSGTSPSSVTLPPPATPVAPVPVNADFAANGTPTWITGNADFYRIDTALSVPRLSTSDWSLRVHGMVDRELTISFDQLRGMRLIEAPITMTCVSNPVGGTLISNARFLGVPMADILAAAGVKPGAQQILSTSTDGFNCNTPLAPLTDGRPAMLAIGMNDQPLPVEHGFPVRMVVPGLYGYVSGCKWITDIEVTTYDAVTSYWEQRGWGKFGPVKTESRIDVPRDGATVPAGAVVAAGVSWAQHKGINAVQVRADGGAWQQAELADEPTIDSWRMWRLPLTLTPGSHTLEVRATDATGYTQTQQEQGVLPDGATGWHSVQVTAA